MTDTTAPRTAAGRRLLAFENHIGGAGMKAERAIDAALGADWKYGDAIADIEREAIGLVRAGVEALPGLTVEFRRDALAMDEPLSKGRFTLPPATMTITQGGPILGRADVLAVIDDIIAAARKP